MGRVRGGIPKSIHILFQSAQSQHMGIIHFIPSPASVQQDFTAAVESHNAPTLSCLGQVTRGLQCLPLHCACVQCNQVVTEIVRWPSSKKQDVAAYHNTAMASCQGTRRGRARYIWGGPYCNVPLQSENMNVLQFLPICAPSFVVVPSRAPSHNHVATVAWSNKVCCMAKSMAGRLAHSCNATPMPGTLLGHFQHFQFVHRRIVCESTKQQELAIFPAKVAQGWGNPCRSMIGSCRPQVSTLDR
mmetsp:Transcript_7085/g.11159  ORF Transcript_7085/g.11159 Transcript_7085/m.11159 type:complete len:244 (+) Transcript_7085:404-1135(+)